MRYYIADPHFFHGNLNTKMVYRGFADEEEMNGYTLQKWNAKVRKNDEVVILGDLSWGKVEETNELLGKLNGRLYLIQGNHDRFLKNKDYNAGNGNPKVYMLYGHVHDTYDQRLIEQFQEITRSSIRENPDGKRWREQEYEQQSLFLT